MASLLTNPRLGNTGVSSLIKSAGTLQRQIQSYEDSVRAAEWAASAKDDATFKQYQSYLTGRISALKTSGSLEDAQRALSLGNTLRSATNANISTSILRENIQIMSGNASPTDKLNLISSQFKRAMSIGDMAMAQSLESQAYSLSQTIQVDAQNAAKSEAALAKANGGKIASAQDAVATNLEAGLKKLNADTAVGGMDALNTTLKDWVKNNKESLLAIANGPNVSAESKAAIKKAVSTSQPGYQDLVYGVGQAMIAAHYLAYQKELPFDPAKAQGYLDKATNLANGTTKVGTLAGDMSLEQVQTWSDNPSMFVPTQNISNGRLEFGYSTGASAGYKYDKAGNIVPQYTGQEVGPQLDSATAGGINDALTKLGFSYKKLNSGTTLTDGVSVQATGTVPHWLRSAIGAQQNLEMKVYVTPEGIQIASRDAQGKPKIYLVAVDRNGKQALYKETGTRDGGIPIFGKQDAAGEYGFNQNDNSLYHPAGSSKPGGLEGLKNTIGDAFYFATHNFGDMVMHAQMTTNQMTAQRLAANQPVSKPIPLKLPTLKGIKMPANQVTPTPIAAKQPMVQPTVSPQNANAAPKQAPSNLTVQGSGINLQGGGGGTAISLQGGK